MPHFAITVALERTAPDGTTEIVAGVTYNPVLNEMFWAEKGAGCWLNDNRRLRVSGRRNLHEALFVTGIPHGSQKTLPATLKDLSLTSPGTAGVPVVAAVGVIALIARSAPFRG